MSHAEECESLILAKDLWSPSPETETGAQRKEQKESITFRLGDREKGKCLLT